MVGLPDGENFFKDIGLYSGLYTIPACDRQTEGRTDILLQQSALCSMLAVGLARPTNGTENVPSNRSWILGGGYIT